MSRTVLIMAGGTGGHIFPGLAVADELRQRGWRIVWLGAKGAMEERLVPQHGYPLVTLPLAGLRGKSLLRQLLVPFQLLASCGVALQAIIRERPAVLLGFGGYPAFPGGLMGRLLWLPLVIHEQNSVAGLTNRVLSRLASRTLFAFPAAFARQHGLVGNPVRPAIAALPAPATRFAGRSGPLRLLVVGGSLGAKVLNEVVPQALALLPAAQRPVVTHQAGEKHLADVQANYAAAGVTVEAVPFIADMARAYAEADVVLCRAGALTVAELTAAGAAAILVPFPYAVDDHQTGNAAYLSQQGAGMLLPQSALTAPALAERLGSLTRDQLQTMATAARQLAKPDAARAVADVCEELTP
jgi:UDP-N-acetylglucosamine--N-acetylmuramyl-(pentapeptide) pyrophosphoryl-undecaprenol N-acetylglucosamine transferase